MARMGRRMLAPISSIKHYSQRSNATVATGAVLAHAIVDAKTKGSARSSPEICEEGCVIKAVFCEYWLCGTLTNVTSQFTFIVYKLPSGQTAPDATDIGTLSAWENKKNILFTSQGVLPEKESSQSVPIIRQWVLIPKGKQRFGLNDKFQVAVFSVGTLQLCGFATYKEYE